MSTTAILLAPAVAGTTVALGAVLDAVIDEIGFDRRHGVRTNGGLLAHCGSTVMHAFTGASDRAYAATPVRTLRRILAALPVDAAQCTFVDYGSGSGRALLVASEFAFRRVVGVEHCPRLHAAALGNIGNFRSRRQRCSAVESVLADATAFEPLAGPIVAYLFNPFGPEVMRHVVGNLARSYRAAPRPIYLIYMHPRWSRIVADTPPFQRTSIAGAPIDFFHIFEARG